MDAGTLADLNATDDDVERTVVAAGAKPISDGLESDGHGILYAGDLERRRVTYKYAGGGWQTLVEDSLLHWVDSMCTASGYLYFTVNQIERMWPFRGGWDRRRPPYRLFRVPLPRPSPKRPA